MSPSDLNQSEKHRLLSAWQAGQLTADQASRLLLAAEADPGLSSEMADLQTIERMLRHQGTLSADGDLFAAEVIARLKAASGPDNGFASAVIDRLQHAQPRPRSLGRPRSLVRRPTAWAAAIGMLVAVSLILAWLRFTPSVLATVAGLEAVRWAPNQSPLIPGQGLPGGTIEIESGFLNLQFESQASLIVEGHARLEILGRNAARLYCGKAAANVPDSAKGFILESPEGRVIDLGTRFGVEVDDQGGTEVHVLQGLVRTAVRGESGTRELHASQGLRLTPGNVMSIAADQSRFLTALPPRFTGPLHYVHWSFDEGQGSVAHDSGVGLGEGNAAARLTSYSAGGPGPSWVAGRFGTALEFNGVDQHVATDFHGIAGAHSRTVACWIRVPRDWSPANAYAIVSWGSMRPGEAWQISVNPEADAGPVGRLRAGVDKGPVVGTRDLRDGQWHHVAVVLYDDTTPRDTTQILLYVDGQLEPAYRKSVHEVRTAGEHLGASNVLLGRDLSPSGRHVFRGTIDEVFIFNAALSQETIQRLMHANQLALPQRKTR
jgi:hypothetical protein